MAITIELFETTGATGSPIPLVQTVSNIGWKNSILDETYPYVDYPISRGNNSFWKYNFFKISGTYAATPNTMLVQFLNEYNGGGAGTDEADNVDLYYKWTNSYATPDTSDLSAAGGTLLARTGSPLLHPQWTGASLQLSTTGPDGTFSTVTTLQHSNNTCCKYYILYEVLGDPITTTN
jgi:hypothetical protein